MAPAPSEGRPPRAVPRDLAYVAPIIGGGSEGWQLTRYSPRDSRWVKGRLFHVVLAEGQLQLSVPAYYLRKGPLKRQRKTALNFSFYKLKL